MDSVLLRRNFTGARHLATLSNGAVYVTDVEVSQGWGLVVIVRQINADGTPVVPYVDRDHPITQLAGVRLTAALAGHELKLAQSGTLGSIADGFALHRFDLDPGFEFPIGPIAVTIADLEGGAPVEVELT
jgi:hypothetical protein